MQGLSQHHYTAEEKKVFLESPTALTEYRKEIERGQNKAFNLFIKNHPSQKESKAYVTAKMKEKLANEFLEQKLIPEWSLGCKVPCLVSLP